MVNQSWRWWYTCIQYTCIICQAENIIIATAFQFRSSSHWVAEKDELRASKFEPCMLFPFISHTHICTIYNGVASLSLYIYFNCPCIHSHSTMLQVHNIQVSAWLLKPPSHDTPDVATSESIHQAKCWPWCGSWGCVEFLFGSTWVNLIALWTPKIQTFPQIFSNHSGKLNGIFR